MACALHYRRDGPADAPAVVLSGSLGTDLSMWGPQASALHDRFSVLRYDLRGHGDSPVPTEPYAMSDLGQDLLALMDRLEIERAALCGLSIGGMISMWVAVHAPERVERLVLFCTSAYLGNAYAERAATVRAEGIEAVAATVLERWFTPRFRERNPELVERFHARLCALPREGYAGCCEAIAGMDLRGDLSAIRAPTLVVAGADDPATPPEHGEAIADGIAGAQFTVLPDAAHLATVEHPDRATALIQRGAE